jgi:hypothetical protein
MHVHGNPMLNGSAAIHSAGSAEKAASEQRASETRRKLLRSASKTEGGLDASGPLRIAERPDGSSGRGQGRQQPNTYQNSRTADDEQAIRPISVWA